MSREVDDSVLCEGTVFRKLFDLDLCRHSPEIQVNFGIYTEIVRYLAQLVCRLWQWPLASDVRDVCQARQLEYLTVQP